jgi:hypothetical protein
VSYGGSSTPLDAGLTGLGLGSANELAACLRGAFTPIIGEMMFSDDPLKTLEMGLNRARPAVGECGFDYIVDGNLGKKLIGVVYGKISSILGVIDLTIKSGPFVDVLSRIFRQLR